MTTTPKTTPPIAGENDPRYGLGEMIAAVALIAAAWEGGNLAEALAIASDVARAWEDVTGQDFDTLVTQFNSKGEVR